MEWKGKIRALGDVNVGAIEQYKEVKERFEFLTAQREDILAAEEKLRQIIAELSNIDGAAVPRAVQGDFLRISARYSAKCLAAAGHSSD